MRFSRSAHIFKSHALKSWKVEVARDILIHALFLCANNHTVNTYEVIIFWT